MGRRLPAALAAVAVTATILASAPGSASSSAESAFVSKINAERDARGLETVTISSDLTAVARAWSRRMADAGEISHDPDLAEKVSGWTALGDNVGRGPTVQSIHEALMESETHRDVILEPAFDEVGVGIVEVGDLMYVTQVFVRRPGGGGSHVPAPKPKAATPPKITAPPASDVVALTGRIWAVSLTAPPITVDVLMQLVALDTP